MAVHIPGINQEAPIAEDGSVAREAHVRSQLMQNARMGQSMRYRRLDRYDRFYHCMEYAHLEHDWNGYTADATETISPASALPPGYTQPALTAQDDVPMARRRPSAPLRLTPTIVDRFTGMMFAEERLPSLSVEGDPEADDFLKAALEDAKFWRIARQARAHGGSMGTAVITFRLTDGRYVFKAHSPKLVADVCWSDKDRMIPAGILIQYITLKEFDELDERTGAPTGRVRREPYCFRRIIDTEWDITFEETRLGEDGSIPADMPIDVVQTYKHDLGKFPGVWIQNIPNGDDIDGVPDCDGAYQLMEEADRLSSQAIRSLKYNMDPTLVTSRDLKAAKGAPPVVEKGNGVGIEVGAGGSAQYLEINANGITAADSKVASLKQEVFTKTQCVIPDASSPAMAGQSGKAMELQFQPMIEKAGVLREQYGDGITRLSQLVLEYARKWRDHTRYAGDKDPVFKIPPKIEEKDPAPEDPDVKPKIVVTPHNPGVGGQVSISWGPYFAPTPLDKQTTIGTIVAAKMGQLLDMETAVARAAEVFGVSDPDVLIRKIREEIQELEAKRGDYNKGFFGGMEEVGNDRTLEAALTPPKNPPSGTPGGFQ